MTYQKIDFNEFVINPFNKIGKEWLLITAKKEDTLNTMTASWGTLGYLWNKPVVTMYIRPQRYTKQFVDHAEYFTITFFNNHLQELRILGNKSGKDCNKIEEVGFKVQEVEGQPTFEQGEYVMICKKIYEDTIKNECFEDESLSNKNYPKKDFHTAYIGEIISIYKNIK